MIQQSQNHDQLPQVNLWQQLSQGDFLQCYSCKTCNNHQNIICTNCQIPIYSKICLKCNKAYENQNCQKCYLKCKVCLKIYQNPDINDHPICAICIIYFNQFKRLCICGQTNSFLLNKCKICLIQIPKICIACYNHHNVDVDKCQHCGQNMTYQQQEQCAYCNSSVFVCEFNNHIIICIEKTMRQVRQFENDNKVQYFSEMYKRCIQKDQSAKTQALRRLKLLRSDIQIERLYKYIQNQAPLIIHVDLRKSLKYYLNDTHYRNIFQLKQQNIPKLYYRQSKQKNYFGQAYHRTTKFQKVKYASLNMNNQIQGIKSYSNSKKSYLLLKSTVRNRTTILNKQTGTIATLSHFNQLLIQQSYDSLTKLFEASNGKKQQNCYKRAHIHGSISFYEDVQRVESILIMLQKFKQQFGVDYALF